MTNFVTIESLGNLKLMEWLTTITTDHFMSEPGYLMVLSLLTRLLHALEQYQKSYEAVIFDNRCGQKRTDLRRCPMRIYE